MLRKTHHQRASMKRSKSDYNNNGSDNIMQSSAPANVVYRSKNTNRSHKSNPDFDFDENDNVPIALPRKEIASNPRERKPSFGTSNSLETIGTYVQEEIQPGVVLEGYAVEI